MKRQLVTYASDVTLETFFGISNVTTLSTVQISKSLPIYEE